MRKYRRAAVVKIRNFVFALAACVLLTGMPVTPAAAKVNEKDSVITGEIPADDDPLWWRAHGSILPEAGLASVSGLALSVSDSVSGYRHDSRFQDGYEIKTGIDVSKFQGTIDWSRVKAEGVQFAFIRAAFRGYGEAGTLNQDPNYVQNITGALNAGIPVGVYIFSQAVTPAEAREEANYVMNMLGGYHISLPIVMDYEFVGSAGRLYNAHLSAAEATNVCKEFCRTVESRGYKAMVYANKTMLQYYLNAAEISSFYKIWLANYTTQTDYKGDYSFWQFRSDGAVNGIYGNVDMNFWYDKSFISYSLVYNGNGATTGSMYKETGLRSGNSYKLEANRFKKTGYSFAGWNTKRSGTGKSYKDKAIIKDLTAVDGAVVTLYAQWKPNTYTIKFDGNGADSGRMSKLSGKKYGTSYKLTANKFKKKGYTFNGWNTKADGTGKKYKDKASVKNLTSENKGAVTLYAQWKKTRYTIQYRLNGGRNNKANPESYTIKTRTIKLEEPTRKGYTFKGWYKDSAYKKKITSISKGSTGNIKLYARWAANKYTIVYDGNGETDGSMEEQTGCKYGTYYTLAKNIYKKKGYKFVGWNTRADGSGKDYLPGQKVKNLKNKNKAVITLYAQWEKKQE